MAVITQGRQWPALHVHEHSMTALCSLVVPSKPKSRGLASYYTCVGAWRRVAMAGVICTMHDGLSQLHDSCPDLGLPNSNSLSVPAAAGICVVNVSY